MHYHSQDFRPAAWSSLREPQPDQTSGRPAKQAEAFGKGLDLEALNRRPGSNRLQLCDSCGWKNGGPAGFGSCATSRCAAIDMKPYGSTFER